MDEPKNQPFDITPAVTLDVTSTLFFELAVSLTKRGLIDMRALGESLVVASTALYGAEDKRAQRICIAAIGNALKNSNIKAPPKA